MSARHFGMTSRTRLGGGDNASGSLRGRYAPANSILLPSDPPLERGKFAQACIDIFAIGFGIFLVALFGIGVPVAIFLSFFVEFR